MGSSKSHQLTRKGKVHGHFVRWNRFRQERLGPPSSGSAPAGGATRPFVDVQSVLRRTATFTVARLLNLKEQLIDQKPLLTNWEVLVEGLEACRLDAKARVEERTRLGQKPALGRKLVLEPFASDCVVQFCPDRCVQAWK